jgi:hypothetical protein
MTRTGGSHGNLIGRLKFLVTFGSVAAALLARADEVIE